MTEAYIRTMTKSIKRDQWRQIGGDVNPSQHGAIIARFDGDAVEIREIQPVRECISDTEAREVGFPFWSKEAYYYPEDLDTSLPYVREAFLCCGLEPEDDLPVDPEQRALCIAECLLTYGHCAEEGPSGWARDVVPGRVLWRRCKRPNGWRYLADEDAEFRALMRRARKSA
jgi:hypothetical protein